ncbi:phage tail protein [Pseudenhygromyxa sp. WMMC2535]|uniref:phage tail protein n=1 Tax=Pseudenhygromyxa sp. WMMC2535 TaxID=2712867 RepID=UPI00155209B7|nr:phage tail protein [Pseudenhygromyxa sp. WMMC2535]NVB36428.1 phage tail protein [Pseudenhygromyxa sp. WMMC2535]
MAQFTVNTHRYDPYKTFKFRVLTEDGKVVAGVSKFGALKRSTEVVSHREGGDPSTVRHSPGQTKYEAVSLERGVSHDREFQDWAQRVYSPEGDGGVSLLNYAQNLTVELLNLQGEVVRAYQLFNCWPSEFTALPELDASANAVAIESMTLQYEGYKDLEVAEVMET